VDPYVPPLDDALATAEGRHFSFAPPGVPAELALAMPLLSKELSPARAETPAEGAAHQGVDDGEDEDEGEDVAEDVDEAMAMVSTSAQAARARLAESIERERRASQASFLVLSGGKDLSLALQTPLPGSARKGGPTFSPQALSPPTAAHAADLGEKVVRAMADEASFIDRLRAELLAGAL